MDKNYVVVEKEYLDKLLSIAQTNQEKLDDLENAIGNIDELVARLAERAGVL